MPDGATHFDSHGIERARNEWGFNSFVTQEGAEKFARSLNRRAHWHVWRLADGSYDFTATADPGHPAELVNEIGPGYG